MIADSRVLHVQTGTGLSGGISKYISSLVCSSSLSSFQSVVSVVGSERYSSDVQKIYGDSDIISLPRTYNIITLLKYIQILERHVRINHISIIHAHALRSGVASAIVSLRTGVPMVYTNHGVRFLQKTGFISKNINKLMDYFSCTVARKVVSIRRYDAEIIERYVFLHSNKLHVIPTRVFMNNADINMDKFLSPPIFLGIGSLIEVKRPDRFLDWIEALVATGMSVKVKWLGDGHLRSDMEALAQRKGLDVVWCGQLDYSAVGKELSEASLLLLTSQFEVFPLSVLEAYSYGVPVISGQFDGVHDFICDGENGFIVDADDKRYVAKKIVNLIEDKELLIRMSINARSYLLEHHLDPEIMAAEYSELYCSCL